MTTSAAETVRREDEKGDKERGQVKVEVDQAKMKGEGATAAAAEEAKNGKGPGKRLHESSDEEDGPDGEDGDRDRRRRREESQGDNDDDDDEDGEEGSEAEDDEDGEEEEGEIDGGSIADAEQRPTDPPLPPGPPPPGDDGWQAIWDDQHQAYYFYNALTGQSTWTNPRVPEATAIPPPLPSEAVPYAPGSTEHPPLEGDAADGAYEPTYYQLAHGITDPSAVTAEDIAGTYAATGTFNRFTGKWQVGKNPENYNDENKSKRQMEFYFDVDAAANSHDGRSLKAERQMKKLSKKELKAFREKRKEKKEQKRRAWLKD